jgi:hypothetical protein
VQQASNDKFNSIMKIINFAFIGFTVVSELALVLVMKAKVNLGTINLYMIAQMITGVTQRATILLSAQLTAVFLKEKSGLNYIMGMIVGVCLIIS